MEYTVGQYVSWNELENIARALPAKAQPFWLKHCANMLPLCGWDWLRNRMHIIPEYKIELITEHSHQTLRTSSIPILRDSFKVYRNPWIKVKLLD